MKRIILVLGIVLMFCANVFGAGSSSVTSRVDPGNGMHVYTVQFTTDASAGTVPDTLIKAVDGYIMSVVTVPGIKGLYDLIVAARNTMNAHAADAAEHATAADTVNFPVTQADYPDPINADGSYNVGNMLRLVGALLTAYDLHDDDAELGSGWAYHIAQESGNATPTSVVKPDTIAEAITRMNNLITVYSDTHDADSTAHTTGGTHAESTADAGSDNPTTLWDVILRDDNGLDAGESNLGDRSATVVEEVIYSAMPRYVNGNLDVEILNGGNSKTGLVIITVFKQI